MKDRIEILDIHCINQIAAGEVVERPLSVVKELVENALDAGAGKVEIYVENGGISLLKVKDNGKGIFRDDLPLALLSHATSKITKIEDLNDLQTMGFRGEALASIASVAKVSITSRMAGEESGYIIRCAGGQIEPVVPVGSPLGTTVVVQDLFFNTPARRKFLRTQATEMGLIADMVGKLALGRADVAFQLSKNGKNILTTSGNGRLLETIAAVLGRDGVKRLLPVEAQSGIWRVSGYLSTPDFVRSNRCGQTFLLNSRVIRSQALAQSLQEGYHTLIPVGVYPLAVLCLTLPPEEFDVNVHPAKLEVKFHRERELLQFISQSVREVLLKSRPVRQISWDDRDACPQIEKPQTRVEEREEEIRPPATVLAPAEQMRFVYRPSEESENSQVFAAETPLLWESQRQDEGIFDTLHPLAQLFRTYILAADGEDFYIIDQHAAHERVRYEELLQRVRERKNWSQMLLAPESMTMTLPEEQILLAHFAKLYEMGFIIEEFGPQTYLLRAVPLADKLHRPQELFRRFLDEVLSGSAAPELDELLERWVFMTACRYAVKGEETLSQGAMEELLYRLGRAENPYTCPHGRPVLLKMTKRELEKKFYR